MPDNVPIQQNLAYLWYSLRFPSTILDLLLVTLTFFLILVILRRTQAAVLLRGALALALILVAITALLPLPTFTWLLQAALLAGLIATPMIFQPELRRGLERLGRTFGFFRVGSSELAHRVVPEIVRAATNLSSQGTGALIVIEGETNLSQIVDTGIPLNANVSSDLLETIFFDRTPLHDGAVVVRQDQIIAAACVLPLSEQALPGGMHQGTRHRAAVGVSEQTDSLAVVVSEETGTISVASRGKLNRPVEAPALRDHLYRFYDPLQAMNGSDPSSQTDKLERSGYALRPGRARRTFPSLVEGITDRLRSGSQRRSYGAGRNKLLTRSNLSRLINYGLTLLLAMLLAVVAWLLIIDRVNPPISDAFNGVELRVTNQPEDLVLTTSVPTAVAVNAQAPRDVLSNLLPQSFRASLDLSGLEAEVHRVPVDIRPSDPRVRVIGVDPPAVDIELQPFASKTMTVALDIQDPESLPFSYEIGLEPSVNPGQVTVQGPLDLVERAVKAETQIALRGARSDVQEERPVVVRDANDQAISGLSVVPERVQVTVPIRQRFGTKDAAVHAVISGTVASGYWIRNISVSPQTVTLLGPPTVLNEMGGFVDTVAIDVTGAAGDVVRRVPLDPPPGVSALNQQGAFEGSVEVRISIVPQQGNLRLTLPVDVIGATEGTTVSKSPASVDVILSGALPVLDEVNADPKLVRVVVDVSGLSTGTYDLTPTLVAPEALTATLVPNIIQVRIERPVPTETPPIEQVP